MLLGGLQKLTLIDFPNSLACTVFTVGCNFRCPWCYSPELVLPHYIKEQPKISERYFFDFLKEKRGFLDGVVICGGEPTIHNDLPVFCAKIKSLGYKLKLDTNGSRPEMLKKLLEKKLVDYVAMDIKAPKEKYAQTVGYDNVSSHYLLANIESSIELLKKQKSIDYEFRTTMVPSLHTKEDILNIIKWIGPAARYYLQRFQGIKTLNPDFENLKSFPEEEVYQIKECATPFFDIFKIR